MYLVNQKKYQISSDFFLKYIIIKNIILVIID